MNSIIKNIYEEILKTAKELDSDCQKDFHFGLFYMPELAYTYECAKHLMENKASMFGADEVRCYRDSKIGDNGINDLIIEHNKVNYVFEIKLDKSSDYYISDIQKLHKTKYESNVIKICLFCKCFSENDKGNERKWFEDNVNKNLSTDIKLEYLISDPIDTEYPTFRGKSFFVVALYIVDPD